MNYRFKVNWRGAFNLPAAAGAMQADLRRQWLERFATGGASDGPGYAWMPLRHRGGQPLVDKGTLRNATRESVSIDGRRITVQFGSAMSGPIPLVHNFGTKLGKDIVPVTARALFIPLTGRAVRSTLEGGVRVGQTGSRRGRAARPVKLRGGRDFILRTRIPATAEKRNRAIPARPFVRVTEKNARELKRILAESQGV